MAPLRPQPAARAFSSALADAGLEVEGLTSNSQRHTAASMAIADGTDIAAVAEMMGNNPSMTLSTYTHAIEERKVALAEQAASRYLDKVQNKVQAD